VPFFRNLFARINQPTAWSFLTGRNAGSGYCEDWKYPQRETVAFCVFGTLRPSAYALGLGLGGPWVAKRGPSVAQGRRKRRVGEMSLFATKTRKWRAGVARKARLSPESHVIGRQARSSREIDKSAVEQLKYPGAQSFRRRGRLRSINFMIHKPYDPHNPQIWLHLIQARSPGQQV
jgi:hypothetical protein